MRIYLHSNYKITITLLELSLFENLFVQFIYVQSIMLSSGLTDLNLIRIILVN